jgi:hypothetical protein
MNALEVLLGVRSVGIPVVGDDHSWSEPGTLLEDRELRYKATGVEPHPVSNPNVMFYDGVAPDGHLGAQQRALSDESSMPRLKARSCYNAPIDDRMAPDGRVIPELKG